MEHSRTLGRTGLDVYRIGVSASYGVPAAVVEQAVDRGVNYLYFGSIRRGGFADALRNLAPRRDRVVLAVQSYTRMAALMAWSLERALKTIRYERADVLLLGMWNKPVSPRIVDAARKLQQRGLVRYLAVSTHQRKLVPELARPGSGFDVVHFRYNAAHPGAEQDIFPYLAAIGSLPGMVSFTSTSWKQLMDPKRAPAGERVPTAADCYRFVLSRPEVDVCMTGPSSAAHMDEALRALDAGPMPPDELAWMRRVGGHA